MTPPTCDWVYFIQTTAAFPYTRDEVGWCLGPSKNKDNAMCQLFFQQIGKIVLRQTTRRLRPEELTVTNVSELNTRTLFDSETRDRIGDSISLPENEGEDSMEPNYFDADSDDVDAFENSIPNANAVESIINRINQQFMADLLINAKILIFQDETV